MPEDRTPCRDYERGVCSRGDNCKYFHSESADSAEISKLPICKDYQNKGCGRMKCKFLHITPEEETEYNISGKLPEHGGRPEKTSNPSHLANNVCKDFLNGICDRGSRCKFMHISERELHQNDASMGAMYGKRLRGDDFYGGGAQISDAALFEENELLRRKITDLQKEVVSLRGMNDTLYEQNNRYCSQLHKENTSTANPGNAYNQMVYPQYTQAAYPATTAALPTTASGVSAYSYHPF